MTTPLRLLIVDDSEGDAILIEAALRRGGFDPRAERVWTREAMDAALESRRDAIISDYAMPQFDGLEALALAKARGIDVPFIIVSGAIGEKTAVAAMKAGAHDYVMKQDLSRLGVALTRELAEAEIRRAGRLAEANLRSSEALLNSIVNTAADGIVVVDAAGLIEFANPAVERMFGYKPIELVGKGLGEMLLADSGPGMLPLPRPAAARAAGTSQEASAGRRDGNVFPVELTASAMHVDGTVKATVVLRDVSERRSAEERIRRLAHFDELSGLPNRALFHQMLNQALRETQVAGRQLAVLFIDLDRFKIINDTLGHDVGDQVLRQVATRLAGCLPQRDTIARFGGDEFVVMMHDIDGPPVAAAAAQKILDALAEPFLLDGQEYHLSASIGISAYPGDGEDAQTLMRNADIAMYRAKEQGKNNYQFHSAQMNLHSFERLVLERFLRRALEQGEFLLHYQPKVEIQTGRVVGMEALLRWHNPGMGTIPPAKFIPLAEETGLIVPIGEWILRRACAQARAFHDRSLGPLRMAVNLSARQFAHDELVADVARALADTGLDPDCLELEITESMVMHNPERAVALLRELRDMGVHLAIDDFGTGYSSLAYLKRFPVDSLKIDRSFIRDIPGDADDVAITRAVIAMAHSLRLSVIAEGVETQEQVDFLRAHACDQLQGHSVSCPLPADEFVEFMLARAAVLPIRGRAG